MRQIQIEFYDRVSFQNKIKDLRRCFVEKTVVFQVFYDKKRQKDAETVSDVINEYFPEARYFGSSSSSNIKDGAFSRKSVIIVCMVFESEDAKVDVLHYVFNDKTKDSVCDAVLKNVAERSWIKGVEMLLTLRNMSSTSFCEQLSKMREDIAIFGGCAFSDDLNRDTVSVFSDKGGFTDEGAVFLLIGGEDIHIWTTYISGWKPLGKKMVITKVEGNHLFELDGEPAYKVYKRYLKIENNNLFLRNALEFPLIYNVNNSNILRVPAFCLKDDTLIMTADMTAGATAQLSYGDPQTILKSIIKEAEKLADFVPDGILIFNCASRRHFWGDEEINQETLPFKELADTAGFFTAGEFCRSGVSLNQHNATVIIVGLREGPAGMSRKDELIKRHSKPNDHMSMISRLANFIDVAYSELDEINKKLEEANKRLTTLAIIDELTKLYNRREINHRISNLIENNENFSLVMLDLDYFKAVNDEFGHETGDMVLKEFAKILRKYTDNFNSCSIAGRWGGEEFMLLTPHASADEAFSLAEDIRKDFEAKKFDVKFIHTVSCGVTSFIAGENIDTVCTRADRALYTSKNNGRNCTTVL